MIFKYYSNIFLFMHTLFFFLILIKMNVNISRIYYLKIIYKEQMTFLIISLKIKNYF